jgi:hypothetical protein
MKINKIAIVALVVSLSSVVHAKTHEAAVYSPEHGIVCDKKAGFCVDEEGISMGFTEIYLGKKAVKKFMKMTAGMKDMDLKSYTLSNGLSCDSTKRICKKSKWDEKADEYWTKVLFSKSLKVK